MGNQTTNVCRQRYRGFFSPTLHREAWWFAWLWKVLFPFVWALCVMMTVYKCNKHHAAQSPSEDGFRVQVLSGPSHVSVKELTRNQRRHRHPSTLAPAFIMCYGWNSLICQLQLYLFIFSQWYTVTSCSLLSLLLSGQREGVMCHI